MNKQKTSERMNEQTNLNKQIKEDRTNKRGSKKGKPEQAFFIQFIYQLFLQK